MLAEHWNGTTWTSQTEPSTGGEFNYQPGLACSVSACTAVGDYITSSAAGPMFAERWSGLSWALETVPATGEPENSLQSVSCPLATACVAVGYAGPNQFIKYERDRFAAAAHWNGAWVLDAVPSPAGVITSTLYAVSCASGTQICIAVGNYRDSAGRHHALSEQSLSLE